MPIESVIPTSDAASLRSHNNQPPANIADSCADVESMPIEKCFEELEGIVVALESQADGLDESLRLFERGMKLSARCSRELTRVERQRGFVYSTWFYPPRCGQCSA